MFFKKGLVVALLLATKLSHAAIWAPTAPIVGDTNFFDLNTLIGLSSNLEFGIFEDTADVSAANATPVLTFIGGTTVTFTPNSQNPTNWNLVSSNASTGTLLDSYNFQIAYKRSNVWETEQSSAPISLLGSNTWQFSFGQGVGALKTLYVVDIKQGSVISDVPVLPTPLPATAWFMCTALVGLFFTGRRKA
jgi:hypothetical protein